MPFCKASGFSGKKPPRLQKGGYLIGYDISHPKRLVRVHKYFRRVCLGVQFSVYYFFGTQQEVEAILAGAEKFIQKGEDDIRAWPVANPEKMLVFGENQMDQVLIF